MSREFDNVCPMFITDSCNVKTGVCQLCVDKFEIILHNEIKRYECVKNHYEESSMQKKESVKNRRGKNLCTQAELSNSEAYHRENIKNSYHDTYNFLMSLQNQSSVMGDYQ